MSTFISLEFTGSYSNLMSFFDSKGFKFDVKPVSPNKILIKLPADMVEDLTFFTGNPLDEKEELMITSIKTIDESEFSHTAENGFEIINREHEKKSTPEVEKKTTPEVEYPIISSNEIKHQEQEFKKKGSVNEQGFPVPLVDTSCTVKKTEEKRETKISADVRDNIASALSDAILPSKSPLPQDDPFVYLTSKSYMKNFITAATLILFVITLLD